MSSVQNKLLNLEATPPQGLWDKIAAELDDSELEYQYPSRLAALAIAAPNGMWEKIASGLDAANTPSTIAEKLLAYQAVPPATTWNKIETLLDAEQVAAIPNQRRIFPFLKYAAAAALIGAIAWGGVSLLNNKTETATATKQSPAVLPPANTTPVTNETAANDNEVVDAITTPTIADEARNDAALEASKKTYAKLEIGNNSKIKNAANFYFGEVTNPGVRRIDIEDEIVAPMPSSINEASRYILLMTPDGNIIRMSKKWGNLVCCVSGEDQDEDCKDQMKRWRQKMATSSASHSPGNFMDILSLVESLQEDND